MPAAAADLILKRFHATLDTVYGDRIERVVLFGSRAHGVRRVSRFGLVFLRGFGGFSFSGRSSPCRGVRRARGLADRGEIVPCRASAPTWFVPAWSMGYPWRGRCGAPANVSPDSKEVR
jgi:hypothetical protein